MKIAILDGYTSTMGELDWKSFEVPINELALSVCAKENILLSLE